jgi:ABC-type transport system substrate-binding protein
MGEAGLTRDAGGFFSANAERFRPELMSVSGLYEREATLLQETWSRAGLDVQTKVLPSVQVRDNEARATFPEMYASSSSSGEAALNIFTTSEIGHAGNRWAGGNRGGWSSPELERCWEAFNTDLPRDTRNRDVVEMMKVLSSNLPYLGLGFVPEVWAHLARLQGPEVGTPDTLTMWNMHEWDVR